MSLSSQRPVKLTTSLVRVQPRTIVPQAVAFLNCPTSGGTFGEER